MLRLLAARLTSCGARWLLFVFLAAGFLATIGRGAPLVIVVGVKLRAFVASLGMALIFARPFFNQMLKLAGNGY